MTFCFSTLTILMGKRIRGIFVVPYEFQANKENIPKYCKNTKIPKMKIS